MLIGVPKEIKKQEERVGATPSAVASLVHAGHSVIVEKGAGVGSGFPDKEYIFSDNSFSITLGLLWRYVISGNDNVWAVAENEKDEQNSQNNAFFILHPIK